VRSVLKKATCSLWAFVAFSLAICFSLRCSPLLILRGAAFSSASAFGALAGSMAALESSSTSFPCSNPSGAALQGVRSKIHMPPSEAKYPVNASLSQLTRLQAHYKMHSCPSALSPATNCSQ